MLIRIDDDIKRLTVYAHRTEQETVLGARRGSDEPLEVFSLDDPVLLTDTARIAQLPPSVRDAAFALFQSYPRVVAYDGVEVSWSPHEYPRVWCPSIDTVFFARALKPYLTAAHSVAEIGTGSGFLTKFALTHGPQIANAVATDISLEALRCASAALEALPGERVFSLVCPQPDDPTLGFGGFFDLLFTNPPYIPRPSANHDNPYEGLGLVHKLADQADRLLKPGGKLLINLSSLSGPAPYEWFTDNGWQVREIDSMTVPLKVNAVTSTLTPESREWLAYLLDKGTLRRDEGGASGYEFWHDLHMLEITRTP